MRSTVHNIRSIIYLPVKALAFFNFPLPFVLALGRLTVKVDAPLRGYLLRGVK